MKEKARNYFLEQDCNCAESVLRAANDTYQLGVSQEDITLVSAFGGGMGCGKTCGALCGAMAVLGKKKGGGQCPQHPGFQKGLQPIGQSI